MPETIAVKLRFALHDGNLVNIREFEEYRGRKEHPRGLMCPECERPVMARLSPEQKIRDHFAHYPDSECALREGGETVSHYNAKVYMTLTLRQYKQLALGYVCRACESVYPYLEFQTYDAALPESKVGNRRPDVSCFAGKQHVGSVEVFHTSRVYVERAQDLVSTGAPWFELPVSGVHPRFWSAPTFQRVFSQDTLVINARHAGVIYPVAPDFCDPCILREPLKVRRIRLDMQAALERAMEERAAQDGKLDDEQRERFEALLATRFQPERFREIVTGAATPIPSPIVTGLEMERIMPELDEYGVRLSMKMSGALYVMTANARREAFLATKAGRKKPIDTEEE